MDFVDVIWKKKLSPEAQAENKSQNKFCSNAENEKKKKKRIRNSNPASVCLYWSQQAYAE